MCLAVCRARMLKASVALLALVTALVAVPAPANAAADAEVGTLCYNYLFVADYQWYFLCVNPKDASCPVYTVRSNHPDYPRGEPDCVAGVPAVAASDGVALRCIWTGQDLDYTHYVCFDLRAQDCQVWQERRSGGHTTTSCLVALPGAAIEGRCVFEFGDLDYRTEVCYGGDVFCPVYFQHSSGGRTCVGTGGGLLA